MEISTMTPRADGRPDRRPLSEQVAESITDKLIADGLKPGDRLPTEPELAETYEVSRSVIREAGRILVERGLVDIRAGRGMIMADFDGAGLSRQLELMLSLQQGSFQDLMDMRLGMEVGMTEYAATKRDAADLARITSAVASFASSVHHDEALQADLDFHSAVAEASHNPFFVHVINPVNEHLRKVYSDSLGYDAARAQTQAEHELIARAIEQGDAAAASAAARAHLLRIVESAEILTAQGENAVLPS